MLDVMIAALRARVTLLFMEDMAAVTLIRQSTTAVAETWAIIFYGAMPLWLWFKGTCIRVLDDSHA